MLSSRCSFLFVLIAFMGVNVQANSTLFNNNLCFNTTFNCVPGSCPSDCDAQMFECFIDQDKNATTCDHVDLFEGNIGRDVAIILVVGFFLMLASVGGIGGGGIVVPMLLIIGGFPSYYGVPLSVTAIVGGAIVLFAFQITKHHPNPEVEHRPLIHFDVIILLLPTALAGTVIGVLINSVSPNWFVLAIIFIVLSYTTYKTVNKGIDLHRKEKEARDSLRDANEFKDTIDLPEKPVNKKLVALGKDEKEGSYDSGIVDDEQLSLEQVLQKEALSDVLAEEARFPWKFLVVAFSELAGLIVLNILRGGSSGSILDIECNSGEYWGLTAAIFIYLFICSIVGAIWVKRRYDHKVQCGYEFVEGDVHFNNKTIIRYPIYAFVVGLLAGFLGIGGGMVLGPLLLHLGMIPLVSSATSSFMNLFTSTSSTVQYLVLNRVPWDYGLMLFLTSGVASAFSQLLVGYVRRSGRNSIIVFVLAFVIGTATVMLCVSGSLQIKEDADQGVGFGFKDFCD